MIAAAIRSALKEAAKQGEGGDTDLAHVSKGDVPIPRERITPAVKKQLEKILGKDLPRFTVGNPANKRNPKTGLASFDDGDTGGGNGSDAAGGPGDPAGSPGDGSAADSGASGATGAGSTGDTGTGSGHGEGGVGGEAGSGGTGANASDASTGMSGTDSSGTGPSGGEIGTGHSAGNIDNPGTFGGPGQTDLGTLGNMLGNTITGAFTGLSASDVLAGLADFGFGAIPGVGTAISAANLAGKLAGYGSLGQAMVDHGVDTGANPGGTGDPGGSNGGDAGRGITDRDVSAALFGAPDSPGRAGRIAAATSSAGAPAGATSSGSGTLGPSPVPAGQTGSATWSPRVLAILNQLGGGQ